VRFAHAVGTTHEGLDVAAQWDESVATAYAMHGRGQSEERITGSFTILEV
jgi:hypothetical protein